MLNDKMLESELDAVEQFMREVKPAPVDESTAVAMAQSLIQTMSMRRAMLNVAKPLFSPPQQCVLPAPVRPTGPSYTFAFSGYALAFIAVIAVCLMQAIRERGTGEGTHRVLVPPEPRKGTAAPREPRPKEATTQPEDLDSATNVGISAVHDEWEVKDGDTLSEIAQTHYGTSKVWPEIKAENPWLKSPESIRPGMRLKLLRLEVSKS